MQQVQIIGNLGEDAQVREFNGRKFVTFRVACSEKIHTQNGDEERTTWYSCSYNNMQSGVLQYLLKGQSVFVQGRPTYAIYDSATLRMKMVDVRIFVDVIQLCGRKPEPASEEDNVPTF